MREKIIEETNWASLEHGARLHEEQETFEFEPGVEGGDFEQFIDIGQGIDIGQAIEIAEGCL